MFNSAWITVQTAHGDVLYPLWSKLQQSMKSAGTFKSCETMATGVKGQPLSANGKEGLP
jgi:hypothetical protein